MRPHVTAMSNYTVIEWWGALERKLTIYVTKLRGVEAIQVWGSDMFNEMRDGPVPSTEHFESLMRWCAGEGGNPPPNMP